MPKKILIVDDDKMIRDTFVLLLTQFDYLVDTAIDGEDALNKLSNFGYDLVISDINMPKLNGIDLYRCVVKTYPHLSEKVILVTGSTPADFNTLSALKNKIIIKTCVDELIKKAKLLLTMQLQ